MKNLQHLQGDIVTNSLGQSYKIIDILGKGNSGTTYVAQDLIKPDVKVALKVLSFQQTSEWKIIELFEREAKVLAQLKHPGIPRYFDSFYIDTEHDRQFFLVEELAEGKSLLDWVESGWNPDEATVKNIAEQILEILIYLQQLEPPIIHRDIKPSNIIRDKDGKVFLVDFGAVRDTYYTTFMHGSTVVGTFGYMAPEQFRGKALPATDLYGLGATLLFLLTHLSPTELPTKGLAIDFRSKVQISEGFANWLEKMIAPDASERFTCAQLSLIVLREPQLLVKKKPKLSAIQTWISAIPFCCAIVTTMTIGVQIYNQGALHTAIMINQQGIAKVLLKNGADINAPNTLGQRPLDVAILYDKQNITKMLIQNGADINTPNIFAQTPLDVAILDNRQNIVKILIKNGVDVNFPNSFGFTPLDITILKNRINMGELLIKKSADVNAKNRFGDTPLATAIQKNRINMAELLIKNGANVNAKNNRGNTLLHLSILRVIPNMTELLIKNGANVNNPNHRGTRPLHLAIGLDKPHIAKLLIKNGADVNAKDKFGKIPLHNIHSSSKEIVKILIKNGADVNTKDNKGQTPLDTYLDYLDQFPNNQKDKVEKIKILLAQGAKTKYPAKLKAILDDTTPSPQ